MKLSEKEIKELKPMIMAEAKKCIVCDDLQYIESKEFNAGSKDHSVYHVFGALNKRFNCLQAVTYSPTSKSISFRVHTIACA